MRALLGLLEFVFTLISGVVVLVFVFLVFVFGKDGTK